jgi:hypothetical protein
MTLNDMVISENVTERMWKEAALAKFQILWRHLPNAENSSKITSQVMWYLG